MKILVLFLVFSIALSIYDTIAIVKYALKWWNARNPKYIDYAQADHANFVTQCMISGGFSTKGCNLDAKGGISSLGQLKTCLALRGFKAFSKLPKGFKVGYPVISSKSAGICTKIEGNKIFVASHSPDHDYFEVKNMGPGVVYYK